jgi:hypothetical protein
MTFLVSKLTDEQNAIIRSMVYYHNRMLEVVNALPLEPSQRTEKYRDLSDVALVALETSADLKAQLSKQQLDVCLCEALDKREEAKQRAI